MLTQTTYSLNSDDVHCPQGQCPGWFTLWHSLQGWMSVPIPAPLGMLRSVEFYQHLQGREGRQLPVEVVWRTGGPHIPGKPTAASAGSLVVRMLSTQEAWEREISEVFQFSPLGTAEARENKAGEPVGLDHQGRSLACCWRPPPARRGLMVLPSEQKRE